jgi:hypothetical protein
MPKLVTRPPKYAFHKASGQAVVKINGKVVYLGRWNTPESKIRYQDAVRSWADGQFSGGHRLPAVAGPAAGGLHGTVPVRSARTPMPGRFGIANACANGGVTSGRFRSRRQRFADAPQHPTTDPTFLRSA